MKRGIRSTFARRDLVQEALAGLLSRPARLLLTALGTVLGIAALVSTLGLAKTAGNQIVSRFDELAATSVSAEPAGGGFFDSAAVVDLPWDSGKRVARLNGVVAAGTKSEVDIKGARTRSVPVVDPLGTNEHLIPVFAASGGLFDAVRAEMLVGRSFDDGHNGREALVAVLGPGAADKLNITRIDRQPAIFVGDQSFVVVGILDNVARQTDLLNAIVIPDGAARRVYGLTAPGELHIETEIGAAQLIADQTPVVLHPNDPNQIAVSTPPEPTAVRADVEGDVNALFVVLGGVSLLVGALGIANVTLVSVLERTPEIGLRRALGAARRHIAGQFLLESTITGLLGGLIGAAVGILLIVAVSAARDWVPVLQSWLPFAAAGLGGIIGLVAGTYPAWRASRTEPIAALRGT